MWTHTYAHRCMTMFTQTGDAFTLTRAGMTDKLVLVEVHPGGTLAMTGSWSLAATYWT